MKLRIIFSSLLFIATFSFSQNLQWAEKIGGSSLDAGAAVETDISGNVYITGVFTGTADFNPLGTPTLLTSSGLSDIFVCKYNNSGNLIWAKKMGGADDDQGLAITIDNMGNVIITGFFRLTADFDPGASTFNLTSNGGNDIFISKLDLNGNFVWAKSVGSSNPSTNYGIGRAVISDGSGNIYITGVFDQTVDFDPGSNVFNLLGNSADVFNLKLDSNGNFLWATQFGSSGADEAYSLAFDSNGNLYTTGQLAGTCFFQKRNISGGVMMTITGIGPSAIGRAIQIDSFNNIFIIGQFTGTVDFYPGAGIYNLTSNGLTDIFILKFSSAGNFIWVKSFGGLSGDVITSSLLDGFGNISIAGSFKDVVDFDPSASIFNLSSSSLNTSDAYYLKLDTAGIFKSVKSFGGLTDEIIQSFAIDNSNNVYCVGSFSTTSDFDPGSNVYNLTSNGLRDAFLLKLSSCPSPFGQITGTTNLCQGSTVTYSVTAINGATSYIWSVPNGAIINGGQNTASINVTFTSNLSGNLIVVPTNSICSGLPLTLSVTVVPSPTLAVSNATICSGSSANLTATGATTYSWSTGATTSSISVTPTANSNYTVIGTTNGCTNTKTVSVTVKATPTVAVSNATICSGSFANLTATGATTYSWNTGATTSSISVTPTANSNYTVTGTTNGCTNTKTVSVFVKATPTVAVSNATICSGNSANLAATGATTYSWSTGATTSSISVTPTVNSNYTVTGTTNGCTNTKTVSVTVKATPTVAVSNATICSGNSANLAATGATTYSWSTGATTSSISVTPTVNSNYTLTGTTNGCTNAKTVSVTVKATPTVAVSNATICSGSSANLTATGATTYSWSTGATSSSIAVTPTATINYTVTGTTNGCTDTKTVNVLVNNLPQLTVNSATICSGATATLTALGASTYTWDTGLVSPSLTDSPTINTTYTVTGTSLAGCINTATASIIIGSAPSISVNSNAICSGSSIVLTANGVSTYTWNTGANTSTIVVSPNITTTYTVSGYLVGCSVQTSNTATVTVNPLPTVSLNTIQSPLCVNNPTVQLSGSPTGGIYSGTGVSGSSFDPAVSGAGTFTINYSYNDANSCSATASQSINVNLCTGIAELDSESVFISPNPASTVINVKMNTTLINNAEIELYDATGKLITQQKVLNENTLLNINDLANGIYTVRVITNNEQIVKRIIKQL